MQMKSIPNLRWWIAGLLTLATALNYLDRQTLPVVISEVQKDIPLSDADYSRLQFFFLLAYGLMYAGGGRLVDKLGSRIGYLVVITWWSAATLLHGFANSIPMLAVSRFLLGLGEGGDFRLPPRSFRNGSPRASARLPLASSTPVRASAPSSRLR